MRNRNNRIFPEYKEIEIIDFAAEGKTISKIENKVIFSEFGAPGDIVDLKVYNDKKSFAEARITKIHKQSNLRTDPPCIHFKMCGGCKWQHIQYKHQIEFKQQQVKDQLQRIGKINVDHCETISGSSKIFQYRNKLEFSFSNKTWVTTEQIQQGVSPLKDVLGYHYPGRFDKVIDIQTCLLFDPLGDRIRNAFREFALEQKLSFFDIRDKKGLLRTMMFRKTEMGDFMVLLQFGENNESAIQLSMEFLKNNFPEITSLLYTINTKGNDTLDGLEIQLYHGKAYIEEKMGDLIFRIGPKSFYQTNSTQAHELYKITAEFAELKGDQVVYDLYTGTGTIANFVSKRSKKVVGIEYVAQAIEDAKVNASINNHTNLVFYAGDMKNVFTEEFIKNNGKPDVIITDPPRAGMHEDVIKVLLDLEAPLIVYVSCNAATQARDLEMLSEKYTVTRIKPVDMFPHTHHVENVVQLKLK